jgi:Protein of unknown function (DUF2938)
MQRMFGVPANWKMVGRWLGRMSKCEFVQANIGQAEPVPGEHALGWTFHYVIGIAYGLLLVAIRGAGWLRQPGIAEPLILALTHGGAWPSCSKVYVLTAKKGPLAVQASGQEIAEINKCRSRSRRNGNSNRFSRCEFSDRHWRR